MIHDFQFAADGIDWEDESVTANSVTKKLMGSCSHWSDSERPGHLVGLNRLQLEVAILREAGWRNWGGTSWAGKEYWRHFLTLTKLITPRTDIHPDFADSVKLFCELVSSGNKGMHMLGSQNCLAPHEVVRLYGGGAKRAGEVVVGDLLMGPDGGPRRVLSTCSGEAEMFRITPKVGRPWECTGNHLVTVVCKRGKKNNGGKTWSSTATPGKLYEFTAEELSRMPGWKLDNFGLKSVAIDFPVQKPLPYDPYIYGSWLGDGTTKNTSFTVDMKDYGMIDDLCDFAKSIDHRSSVSFKNGTAVATVNIAGKGWHNNRFLDFIRTSVKGKRKFVLDEYLTASRADRMQLLAGLIDTDGWKQATHHCFCSSEPILMDGVEKLANSLGFRTSRKSKTTNYRKKDGTTAATEILSICGDCCDIPVRIARKVINRPKQGKGVRKHGVTGFTSEPIGVGRYNGFTVDCDHRFLKDDGTILHNCGKSGGSTRIAFTVMAIFPRESAIYYANPFDSASDSTIWGEVEECYDEVVESNPTLFPDANKFALRRIELIPDMPRAGTMEIRNVKHVGKFKGTKTVKSGEVEGLIVLIIDEVNEIQNFAFMRMLANLASQEGFFVVTSQNFKDPGDMGGQLAMPSSSGNDGVRSYADLNSETSRIWWSHGASATIRFNGLNSPNIKAGRTIYKYLFTKANLEYIVDTYGEDSPEYFSQVLSFPMEGDDARSVLSRSRINASMHDDQFYSIERIDFKASFADPSFGGGDSAVWGQVKSAFISYKDHNGEQKSCNALIFDKMVVMKVMKRKPITRELLDFMMASGVDVSSYAVGDELPPEDQVAMQCRNLNIANGIISKNFGYDFSMRPDCITSMARIVGSDTVPFDYNTDPNGHIIKSLGMNSVDCCRNRVDELGFITSDVFANQRVRGGEHIEAAILQLSRSRYEVRHGKRIIEKKADYKARWRNQSPDERDVLMGLTGMAYRLGFKVASVVDQRKRAARPAFGRSNRNGKFRRRVGKRLHKA